MTDLEISYRLAQYVRGEEPLVEFRRWLLPLVWDLAEPGNDEVSQLASRIELRLAEYMNGHWTEDDLRGIFERLIPSTGGPVADLIAIVSGSTSSSAAEPLRPPTELVLS
jgi:hypothetical protein